MASLLQHYLTQAASAFPDKDAVIGEGEAISYRELDAVSDKLALTLQDNGVLPGDRVGIYLNKSVASVVNIHGILKAGAVYVPIDPRAPAARLAYIAQNCAIKGLLTSNAKAEEVAQLLPQAPDLQVVALADEAPQLEGVSTAAVVPWKQVLARKSAPLPEAARSEDDLAYILYTSGSTGMPKGVMISHRNAANFVDWCHRTFQVNASDNVSSHAPLHFDLSIFDIFATLKAGGTVHLVPEGLSSFPFRLAEWIHQREISVWYSVPSILSMLVLQGQLERFNFDKLRTVLFAGEVFPVKYLRGLMAAIPHAQYYNLYGPTETNVITYYQVCQPPAEDAAAIPIGKACANTDAYALTDENALVTRPGEIGELIACGPCVAQGYWGNEESTRRSFLESEGTGKPHDRAYKTGDYVTLDDEGNFIFIGRRDHMIKSRGYRIELGEIETALYGHPEVEEAAVVAVPDELIGNKVIAFVVPNGPGKMDVRDLKAFCSSRIPRYMVPEEILICSGLPKTSTGKVDRPTLVAQASDL